MRFFLIAAFFISQSFVSTAGAQTSSPVPAVTDTAVVEIVFPEGTPACLSLAVTPDTLGFGVAGSLQVEFEDSTFMPTLADLNISAPWLEISPSENSAQSGSVLFNIHAYRLNPFRIKVGEKVGAVVFVAGATTDLSETAAIRMPRTWGTQWWILVLAALVLTMMIMSVVWLWQRRLRLRPLDQWSPAPPAWLQASIDLRKLLEDDFPNLQTSRAFLDQLATITRSFLAGRYLVHAGELTSGEILTSCQLKGHDSRSMRRLILLLQTLDHSRYNPESPVVSWCRVQANDLLDAMEDVRILPRYTFVEASLLLEAEKAWSWLSQPENRLSEPTSIKGGTE